MVNLLGALLIDNHGSEWKVLGYQGDTLRVFSVAGNFLSEAEGETIEELVSDLQAIEEVDIMKIIIKGEK